MQTDLVPEPTNQAKFFEKPTKQPMIRLVCYLDAAMYEEITEVSRTEGLDLSQTSRELFTLALRYYKLKRGTLNTAIPQNSKTFYCQICRALTSMRYMHSVVVMYDDFKFCENCFFNDKYKKFISQRINEL